MTPTHSFFCERRDAYDDDIAHSSHSSSSSTHYAHTRWFEYKTWRVEARTSKSDAMSSCVAARNLSSRPSSASSRNRSVSRPSSSSSRRRRRSGLRRWNADARDEDETTDESSLSSSSSSRVFIFGVGGYAGAALATALRADGSYDVCGTCGSEEEAERARRRGVRAAYVWYADPTATTESQRKTTMEKETNASSSFVEMVGAIEGADYVVCTVPPLSTSSGVCDGVLDAFGEALASRRRFVGYLSTTAVYGDHGGNVVNEDSECRGESEKARDRLVCERKWRDLATKSGGEVKVVTYRAGGIYGPGRSALDAARRRRAEGSVTQRARASRKFTSRVHVDDVASVIIASMRAGDEAMDVYNVVDDDPAPRFVAVRFARELLGLPEDEGESVVESNDRGEKRVDNARMKSALRDAGLSMRFPTYREGLRALANEEDMERE
jgi:nucleoside-diphosphate-sugar epimerase